jgi:CRP-like cAMP-binding protein
MHQEKSKTGIKLSHLRSVELFQGLTEDQLLGIAENAREISYKMDDTILKEDDPSDCLYIIIEGEVCVSKMDKLSGTLLQIGTYGPNEIFGEMGLIDNAPRSANIYACKPTKLLRIFYRDLHTYTLHEEMLVELKKVISSSLDSYSAFTIIMQNLAKKTIGRLRITNNALIEGLRNELLHTKARVAISRFLINILTIMCVYIIVSQIVSNIKNALVSSTLMTIPMLIVLGIPLVLTMWYSGYPMKTYGFTLENAQRSAKEAIIFTLPILALIVIYKALLLAYVPAYWGRELFDLTLSLNPGEHEISGFFSLAIVFLYLLFVPVQEILTRGALQSSLQILLVNKYKIFWSIVISNLLFSVMHSHVSLSFGLSTYIVGLFWGWMYARQKTLVGVIISHLMVGGWAIFIVGLI